MTDHDSAADDRAAVRAAVAGDSEAFDALLARHQARIFDLLRSFTRNESDAEDLAQETFIRAFKALSRFKGESSFATWLYRIAVNVAHSHHERRGRQRWSWLPWIGTAEDVPLEERVASDDRLEERVARRQVIDRALASLPEELRVTVLLRDVHGLDYREIAAVLGVPIGTVESRIFRGRQRLRPLLDGLLTAGTSRDEGDVATTAMATAGPGRGGRPATSRGIAHARVSRG